MSNWDHIECSIGTHFLPALINCDPSGLNDAELAQLVDFERAIIKSARDNFGAALGHWSVHGTEEFARCDVTASRGDVQEVHYNFQRARKVKS